MKKRINILILAGLLFSAVACDDSENNFSESTSTRIEQTLERYKFALQAGKTWVMEYFPDENLGYGGWIYIVEFQDDRMVKAWFEGSTFVEADPLRTESEYRIEFSTGPMLKFATHNDYLHFFSFPGDNGAGYQGWKGDYEFTFMSLSPAFDEIILRGIKTGNRIRMTPLSGQYTPESYLEPSAAANWRSRDRIQGNGQWRTNRDTHAAQRDADDQFPAICRQQSLVVPLQLSPTGLRRLWTAEGGRTWETGLRNGRSQ